MRKHGAVMFFRTCPGGAPLEEHDAIGAAGNGLIIDQAQHAGTFGCVALTPVYMRGGLFHQNPWAAIAEGTHQIADHGGFYAPRRIEEIGVTIQ